MSLRRLLMMVTVCFGLLGVATAGLMASTEQIDLGAATALGCLIVGCWLVYVAHARVYPAISGLERSIVRFAGGDLGARAVVTGPAEIREIATVFNDMAENLARQREQQLRFLAAVAHDLRNPLGAMVLSFDTLAPDSRSSAAERREVLGIIMRQAKLLDRMVGDLLDRAQIESGRLELRRDRLELTDLVSDVVGLFRSSSASHRVVADVSHGRVLCRGDGLRLGQVLNNLVSNAIKYSPTGGIVRVRVESEGDEAVVSVSDTGVGISADEIARIFQPFHRGSCTREAIPGVGLGLSVARRIVEAHGGRIEVESAPGRGSTFRVRLPRLSPRPHLLPKPTAVAPVVPLERAHGAIG